jgi:predicted CXXCH cytochrome family protein
MRAEKRPGDRSVSTKNARKHRSISRAGRWLALSLGLAVLATGLAVWLFREARAAKAGGGATLSKYSVPEDDGRTYAAYAGSANCRECHQQEFDLWAKSNHGLAERQIEPDRDRVAFDPPRTFKHGSQADEVRIFNGEFQIVDAGSGSNREPAHVERVIGNDPLRQFLIATNGGRWQAHEAAYDPKLNQWFDVFGDEDRQPGTWGHWTGRGMNWNSRCAECHNTRLRKNYDASSDGYQTKMAEMSIGCEACHGPLKAHVEWRKSHPGATLADSTIVQTHATFLTFGKSGIRNPKSDAVCGSCHSRRNDLTSDFKPGDSYFDHYAMEILDEGDRWYADGQVKEEDYEFASFLSSRMHETGVSCQDCHNPHSMKLVATGNDLCLKCHQGNFRPFTNAPVINALEHGHHQLTGKGAQCVSCHMPVTTYMQRHQRHDHGFTIPDPLLTTQLNIPNACNRCHTDKDATWALGYVEKWYGAKMNRHTRQRAQWIATAQRGDEKAREHLIGMVSTNAENFYWKAVAAGLLEQWADNPAAKTALLSCLADEHPLVREQAVRALGNLLERTNSDSATAASLQALLNDPAGNVRVEAAWALRTTVDLQCRAAAELQESIALDTDQPAGQFRRARILADCGQPEQALACLQKAILWDPLSPPLRYEIATLLDQLGRPGEAEEHLKVACRLEPDAAEAQFKLALILAESHRLDEAAQSLEKAIKLDPRHARAWYNLGLARSGLGDDTGALDALAQSETLAPTDPQIPYASATILARAGRYAEARVAANRALTIAPTFQDAEKLLESLPEGR